MNIFPACQDFRQLAQKHNIIPVYTDLTVDLETPVSLYYKIVGDQPGFMLESAETSKTFGRYSFIGTDPFLTVTAYKDKLAVDSGERQYQIAGAPLAALQGILNDFSFPDMPGLPPFSGGAVGYLAYEAVSTWERVRGMSVDAATILGEFMFCRTIIAMDHLTHSAKLIYLASVSDASQAAGEYDKALAAIAALSEQVRQPVTLPQTGSASQDTAPPTAGEGAKEQYMANVVQAKEYIAAGDIFQAVLSHPFHAKLAEQPFALYRRLRRVNPSPYMFHINLGQRQLVGASPEMLVKLQGGKVFTCPIAGTRPRGKDAAEDERLAAELLADTKERAEHAMLVDLGRNDIGRISLPGTVKVSRMMQIENFSHVMHIVSEVTGDLDPRYTPTEVLAACFPAGTLSGAPKIRAMEIINELEGVPRGAYGGAVGYFDFRGNMDTCITIRTLAIDGDEVVIQTGAGIVADSVPETEYQETIHKAGAMFRVLKGE
ncbi:MAG: anthranilate synthase component I [Negativicutes bacterium]|nr:anthranilate synthase component I [Negativicutes bacterium]